MNTPYKIKLKKVDSELISTKTETYHDIKIKGELMLSDDNLHEFVFFGGNLTLVKNPKTSYILTKEENTRLEQLIKAYIAGMKFEQFIECQTPYNKSSKIRHELED